MVSAINNAISGFTAANTQVDVTAENTANQFSTQSNVNGKTVNKPYVPQQVDQVTLSNGGVQAKVNNVNPPTITVTNPSSPQGTTQLPNVDPNQQAVNQDIAVYNAQADLQVVQAANQMQQSLLNIQT